MGTACTFDEPPAKRRRQIRQAGNDSVSRSRPSSPIDHRANGNDGSTFCVWSQDPNNPSLALGLSDPGASSSCDTALVGEDAAVLHMLQHEGHHDMWFTMLDPTLASFPLGSEEMTLDDINSYQLDPSFQLPSRPPSPSKTRAKTNPAQHVTRFLAQGHPIQQLDSADGSVSAQYFGPSGEMDPYILQHMLFPEDGKVVFGQFQYRQLTSSYSHDEQESCVPANFLIHMNRSPTLLSPEGTIYHTHDVLLENLISPEQGSRLIGL